MKEYTPKNNSRFKLIAHDQITNELFVTVRFDVGGEFENTYIFQKVYPEEIEKILHRIEETENIDKDIFFDIFKGHKYRQATYTLTTVENCIDDGEELVTGECEMPLETLASESSENKEEGVVSSKENARANFSKIYRNIALARKKKVSSPLVNSKVIMEVPAQDIMPLETEQQHKPAYLFDCSYRIVLKESGGRTHSIPIYILAESINDLDSIFREAITSSEFLKRFRVESFVLTSARIIASVKFDENFPLLVSYKNVFSS